MSDLERGVAQQYSSYDVLDRIKAGLAAAGESGDRIRPEALKAVDEFHIGGAEATRYLLDRLDIGSGTRVLDIGSGIGGAARMVAQQCGSQVQGVDLTPAFVETARELTTMCGLADRVSFEVGSATALPFADDSFDVALLLHVGMNIPDKQGIFREARRVLARDGVFAVYDVMRIGPGDLAFPVPWADSPDISALADPEAYRQAADEAGFTLVTEESRREIALDFFARIQAQAADAAPPPLGLHNLMGPTIGPKMTNMIAAIRGGTIAPVLMIFHTSQP